MLFRYVATDQAGAPVTGEIEAANAEAAERELVAHGLKLTFLGLRDSTANGTTRPLTKEEVALMATQISGLIESGLPLAEGVLALACEVSPGRLRATLADIAGRLQRGESLESAIGKQGNRLPNHLRGIVMAGARTGRLGDFLVQFVNQNRAAVQLRRKIAMSLVYPALLMTAASGIVAFMLIGLVPQFRRLFMDFGVELPEATIALLMVSDIVAGVGCFGWIFILGLIGALWFGARVVLPPAVVRRIVYRIPLIGSLVRWLSLAGFSHMLGLLLECKLPLPEALALAGQATADPALRVEGDELGRMIGDRGALSACIAARHSFPESFAEVVRWGDGNNSLTEAMHAAGELAEGQARVQAEFVSRAAIPLVVLVVAGVPGIIIAVLVMPLLQLINELSG